ncbi:hypothetical protein JXB41_03335 [Candidatus Woesearchaeota archaeon]|nr:hypothetical protein [Candidatus Woesearchaeota archaeon]
MTILQNNQDSNNLTYDLNNDQLVNLADYEFCMDYFGMRTELEPHSELKCGFDQEQRNYNSEYGSKEIGQSFIPSNTQSLQYIEICANPNNEQYIAEIRSGEDFNGNLLTNSILTINTGEYCAGGYTKWIRFNFESVELIEGEKYTLKIIQTGGSNYAPGANNKNVYLRGKAYYGDSWHPRIDFMFRTYVCGIDNEICDDKIDNDNDGLVDCEDNDCSASSDCKDYCRTDDDCFEGCSGYKTSLNQCFDNKCHYVDSKVCSRELCNAPCDASHPCDGGAECNPVTCECGFAGENELCNNEIDDDGDGFVDCYDFDCGSDPESGCCPVRDLCKMGCNQEFGCVCCEETCYEAGHECENLIEGYIILFTEKEVYKIGEQIKLTQFQIPCFDSDGGDNVYVKGVIDGPNLVTGDDPTDYCLSDSGKLVEYSCEKTEGFYDTVVLGLYSKSVGCEGEKDCENGVCPIPDDSCNDSDGFDYFTKGNVGGFLNGEKYLLEDSCVDDVELTEYYCRDNYSRSISFYCENRCKEGVCIPVDFCYDTDGFDYFTMGTVSGFLNGEEYLFEDYCKDEFNIVEYYCYNEYSKSIAYDCETGCDDGACTTCKSGETRDCYTGPADTQNIGECRDGTQTCKVDNTWGTCDGETLPSLEICDLKDNDCNRVTDDNTCIGECLTGICQGTSCQKVPDETPCSIGLCFNGTCQAPTGEPV